jgi:hypothetical protein
MAKILGEAGRYSSDQASKNRRRFVLSGIIGIGCIGIILGFVLAQILRIGGLTKYKAVLVESLLAITAVATAKIIVGRLDKYDRERRMMQKGADGEHRVATVLADLPDSFRVINGLSTPFGDLDHIVVGPSGVFIVDAKNWRGVVNSDGRGELLLNGVSTDKATIKTLIARTMEVRDKAYCLFPRS